jgi:hypothetical protein
MRRIAFAVLSILAALSLVGCNLAPMEKNYEEGREKQKSKANDMIEKESEGE